MKNKKVKQMMATIFDGEWEMFRPNMYKLVILEGYFGSCAVRCALHKQVSLTANQLRDKK